MLIGQLPDEKVLLAGCGGFFGGGAFEECVEAGAKFVHVDEGAFAWADGAFVGDAEDGEILADVANSRDEVTFAGDSDDGGGFYLCDFLAGLGTGGGHVEVAVIFCGKATDLVGGFAIKAAGGKHQQSTVSSFAHFDACEIVMDFQQGVSEAIFGDAAAGGDEREVVECFEEMVYGAFCEGVCFVGRQHYADGTKPNGESDEEYGEEADGGIGHDGVDGLQAGIKAPYEEGGYGKQETEGECDDAHEEPTRLFDESFVGFDVSVPAIPFMAELAVCNVGFHFHVR